jgi:hypothetical protein
MSFCGLRFEYIRFVVGVAHCVTRMPPLEFDVRLGRNDKVYEIKKYVFVERTCGRTSVQSFSNFLPSIPFFEIWSEGRPLRMGHVSLILVKLG